MIQNQNLTVMKNKNQNCERKVKRMLNDWVHNCDIVIWREKKSHIFRQNLVFLATFWLTGTGNATIIFKMWMKKEITRIKIVKENKYKNRKFVEWHNCDIVIWREKKRVLFFEEIGYFLHFFPFWLPEIQQMTRPELET